MRKNTLIQVIGSQQFPEGDEEKLEFFTESSFYIRQGVYFLVYQESEVTGMAGVTTTLRMEKDHISLNRMGNVKLKQEFELGILHRSTYITPFGALWLSVLTKKLDTDLTAQGGHISLEYDLFVDDNLISHNTLRINIKEEPPHESL